MEGVPACIVGYVKLLGVIIVPSCLFSEDLEDTSGRTGPGSSGSYGEGTDYFPIALAAFKDGSLLSIMAYPDQVLGLAGEFLIVNISKLDFLAVFLGCIITSPLMVADGSNLGCQKAGVILLNVFRGLESQYVGAAG